jgi:hypothetical protein
MMEAAGTSETLVNFYQTTRCYNPEDSHLRTHRRENLKSYLEKKSFAKLHFGFLKTTLTWHKHAKGMTENGWPKQVLESMPSGRRKTKS